MPAAAAISLHGQNGGEGAAAPNKGDHWIAAQANRAPAPPIGAVS